MEPPLTRTTDLEPKIVIIGAGPTASARRTA